MAVRAEYQSAQMSDFRAKQNRMVLSDTIPYHKVYQNAFVTGTDPNGEAHSTWWPFPGKGKGRIRNDMFDMTAEATE